MESENLLAFCGFYCSDCLGYSGTIADAAGALVEVLKKYQFDRTAECMFPQELQDYDKLSEMLRFMSGLRCPTICREREPDRSPSGCQVKNCCLDKGFYACYECEDFEGCDKLKSLHGGLHYDSSIKNMKAIREMGLEAWLVRDQRNVYWNESDDPH